MMGDLELDEQKGLTPRIVEKIFETIQSSSSDLEFTVKVSYMEIYMERVRDLLNPANDNLPIHEDKLKGVYVKGLLEFSVGSMDEVFEAMRRGQSIRATGATSMNVESSRSHSIFVLKILEKNVVTGSSKTGKLSLVDLAGSEKVGKTGASGQTLEEAKKINKSLSALGMVINALTDGKSVHIPYRDSKLTRILQESLGGNSRTTLLINCSPSSFNEAETISTLRFGVRAKCIKNHAKINVEPSPTELKGLLRKAKQDILLLDMQINLISQELSVWRSGSSVPISEWMQLQNEPKISYPVSMPSTPMKPVTRQDREEWLERENEFEDLISSKEHEVTIMNVKIEALQNEVQMYRTKDSEMNHTNKELHSNFNEVKLSLDHANFEAKEVAISMEGLRESNADLSMQISELRQQISVSRNNCATSTFDDEEGKRARIAAIVSEMDPNVSRIFAAMDQMVHLMFNLRTIKRN